VACARGMVGMRSARPALHVWKPSQPPLSLIPALWLRIECEPSRNLHWMEVD
jgi:hypothetical protein